MTSALRVLSWNLNGLSTTRLSQRTERACMEMVLGMSVKDAISGKKGRPVPDVLCLQEVVPSSHRGQLSGHLGAAGFTLFPTEPPEREDYVLVAVRLPWRLERATYTAFAESPLRRGYLEATISSKGRTVRILTAHMESLRSGAESRVAQAIELDARLIAEPTPALFIGDTNLRKSEWQEAIDNGVTMKDAFALAGWPETDKNTWWPLKNPGRGFRFDRAWLDPRETWVINAFTTRRRPKISDHAAVEIELLW